MSCFDAGRKHAEGGQNSQGPLSALKSDPPSCAEPSWSTARNTKPATRSISWTSIELMTFCSGGGGHLREGQRPAVGAYFEGKRL